MPYKGQLQCRRRFKDSKGSWSGISVSNDWLEHVYGQLSCTRDRLIIKYHELGSEDGDGIEYRWVKK